MQTDSTPTFRGGRIRRPGFRPLLPSIAFIFCTLPGCWQPDGGAEAPDATGTYALASIGGVPVPCTPPHEVGAPEVRSGAITLNADGTFTSAMTYGRPDGREGSRDFRGTFTREGASFRLEWEGAGVTAATLEADTFTMVNEGLAFVYRR